MPAALPPAAARAGDATPRLALSVGEPAGVGPDLVAAIAARAFDAELVLIGSRAVLEARAARLGLPLALRAFDPTVAPRPHDGGALALIDVPLAAAVEPGRLDPRNAEHVLALLETASSGCLAGRFDGVVTAPVHKGVLNEAGIAFRGHTELFAERAGRDVVMLLAGGGVRVALATTHLPLRAVPDAITRAGLERTLATLADGLRSSFGLTRPRIAVLGLNPHAGEDGHLGREEIDVIIPALEAMRSRGLALDGPLAADTAFAPARRAVTDAYLAMYHDQGLPVQKTLGFGASVNVTLGLPYVRTSVDHGTALELAGSGRADASSLVAAIESAIAQLRTRRNAA